MSEQTHKQSDGWMAPLDGARGVSILLVLTAHVYTPGWHDLGGSLGVTIFFVLSGFLITQLLLREESACGSVDLRAFYIRRAFRLFPLYYLILFVYCFLLLVLELKPDSRQGFLNSLPYYAFYFQEIPFFLGAEGESRPFYQSWSLGVEEKFYLVWPLIGFVLFKKARIILLIVFIVFFSVAPFLGSIGEILFPYASISTGCLAALIYQPQRSRRILVWLVDSWRVWFFAFVFICLHVFIAITNDSVSRIVKLFYPAFVALVIIASLHTPLLGRMLSIRPLRVLGELSYGIYLIHLLVRNVVETVLNRVSLPTDSGVLVFSLMLGGSAFGAWVLNRTFEAPIRMYGRRIANGFTYRGSP